MSGRGLFIVVDGIDGAGKSNVLDALERYFGEQSQPTLRTREPGGTDSAERIRDILKSDESTDIPPRAELLLMFAARCLHLEQCIRPALEKGVTILCDRFSDSSFAYQGAGRGVPTAEIEALNQSIVGAQHPDLVLILDVDPDTAQARSGGRGEQDRFDAESNAFMARVRESYLTRASSDPTRYRVINGQQSADQVQVAAITHLEEWLLSSGRVSR